MAHWHRVTTTTSTYELRPTRTVFLLLNDYRGGAASRSRSRISIRCVFASGDALRSHRIVTSLLNYYLYRFRRPQTTAETTFVYFCT